MKCVIMLPSLLRSSRSYLVHIRLGGVVGDGVPVGDASNDDDVASSIPIGSSSGKPWQDSVSLVLTNELVEGSMPLLPKPRPSKFVVGVPLIIHRLSTLRVFANGTKVVERLAETWPSSMTRRFHRTCKRGVIPGT